MYFDELLYATETGFDGVMINEHHNNPLSMMPSVNVIGAVLARTTRKGRIVFLGNVLPDPRQPAPGGRGGRDDRHPLRRASSLRLRARPRPGKHRDQHEPDLQPRAVRRGPRRDRQGLDHAGSLSLGGPPLTTTESSTRGSGRCRRPHPPIWIPGVVSPESVRWAAEHRYPYVALAPPLARHRRDLRPLRRGRGEDGVHADARASRLRHPGERRRHRREGLRGGPALLLAARDVVRRRAAPLAAAPGVREPRGQAEPARAGARPARSTSPRAAPASATRKPTRRTRSSPGTPTP